MGELRNRLIMKIIISLIILNLVCSLAGVLGETDTTPRNTNRNIDFGLEILLEDQTSQTNLTLYPGEHYVGSVEIMNLGAENDTFNLTLTGIPTGWAVTFDNYKIKKSIDLTSNDYPDYYTKIMLIIKVPDNAMKDDSATITVAGVSQLSETQGNPVTRSDSVNILIDYIPPYVFLETEENIKYVDPSESAEFVVTVSNIGYDNLEYCPPNSTNYGDGGSSEGDTQWAVEITPDEMLNLDSGQSQELTVTITAPEDAPAGSKYSLLVKGTVSEDAVIIIPIEVTVLVKQLFDITTEAPDSIVITYPNILINYRIVVCNNGNGNDKLELSLTETLPNSEVSLSNQIIMIGKSEYENITVTIHPTTGTPTGTHHVSVQTYRLKDSTTKEPLEEVTTDIEVQYRPDLTLEYKNLIFSKNNPTENEEIYINAEVTNSGDACAVNVTVEFTPQTKGGSLLNPISTEVIPKLEPQFSVVLNLSWRVDPSVEFVLVNIDPENNIVELSEANNNISKYLIVFPEPNPIPAEDEEGAGVSYTTWGVSLIITAVTVSIIAISAFLFSTEYGKYGFLTIFPPLYSRVKREEVLNHGVRERVYDYVKEHPGDHFRSILTNLELTNGTLVHHLNTLEKKDYIRSERDGPYKRFYPIGIKLTEDALEINGLQKKILDSVSARPGMTQKGLAIKLKTSTPTINYHVKALRNSGLLRVKRDGKVTRCFVEGWTKGRGRGAS